MKFLNFNLLKILYKKQLILNDIIKKLIINKLKIIYINFQLNSMENNQYYFYIIQSTKCFLFSLIFIFYRLSRN